MLKLFLTDLDGCLTDAGYYVFSDMEGIAKKFNTRDFHGLLQLHKRKTVCAVITSSSGTIIQKQIDRLPFELQIFAGIKDKKQHIYEQYIKPKVYKWDEIAFIGDDWNDIELLKAVGVAACPSDAEIDVIELVKDRLDGWPLDRKGGEACVREFINVILNMYNTK